MRSFSGFGFLRSKWFLPLLSLVIVGTVYLMTLLPGLGGFGDTAKFQFVGHVLGTPHTTGYPLYLMITYVYTHLFPFGSLAWKVNFLSLLLSLGGLYFFHEILRLLKLQPFTRFVGTLLLGFTPMLWAQSIIAEVYTLHFLFLNAIVFYLIRWGQHFRERDLLVGMALLALSFGNHLTTLFFLPSVAYWLWIHREHLRSKKIWGWIGLFVLVGASQYLYIFWRYFSPETSFLEMQTPDFETFWWYITGAQFKAKFFAFSWSELFVERLPWFIGVFLREFLFVGVLVGLWGLLVHRSRKQLIFLTLLMLSQLIFSINYNIYDIVVYFLPVYAIFAIFVSVGLDAMLVKVVHKHLWRFCMLLIPAVFLVLNYSINDLSQVDTEQVVQDLLDDVPPQTLVVSSNYNLSMYFWYYLIGLEQEAEREVLVQFEDPVLALEKLEAYDDGVPYDLPFQRKEAPLGTKILVAGGELKELLLQEGYRLSRVNRLLYEIDKRPRSGR